jgi:FlaG/FlaF family flagellin (archaellin)
MLGSYRLESSRKLMRALMIVAAVVAITVFPYSANASAEKPGTEFDYVTVSTGQSLWELADVYAQGEDPRDWIAEVVSLNNLQTAQLQAGQQIALP